MSEVITLPLEHMQEKEPVLQDDDILNLLLGVIRLVQKHGTTLQEKVFKEKIIELLG